MAVSLRSLRDQRQALRLRPTAPNGATEAIMLAHGFTIETLDALVERAGDGFTTLMAMRRASSAVSTLAGSASASFPASRARRAPVRWRHGRRSRRASCRRTVVREPARRRLGR